MDEEKLLAAEISFKLGKYYEERDGNLNEAFVCYNETLTRNNEHKESMVAIARIHQNQGNNEQCEQFCKKILKVEAANEDATYMLANLKLMKEETEGAMNSYIGLLEKNANNYNILANLIELLRKAGRIQEAQKFIENAESKTQRSQMAGLAYCKGLYNRYNSEPQKALRELNFARYDNFYGQSAIQNMIEIYLNPANELIYSS